MLKYMSLSGVEFIKEEENFKRMSYRDQPGIWTIGYGTTWINDRRVGPNMTCTKEQATEWLMKDIREAEIAINNSIYVPLKQHEFDALVSLAYNIGIGAFNNSTLRQALNNDRVIFPDLFTRWCKFTNPITKKKETSNGLLARRKREWTLFSTGDYQLNAG